MTGSVWNGGEGGDQVVVRGGTVTGHNSINEEVMININIKQAIHLLSLNLVYKSSHNKYENPIQNKITEGVPEHTLIQQPIPGKLSRRTLSQIVMSQHNYSKRSGVLISG